VDCIALVAAPQLPPADLSRARHDARAERLVRIERERAERLAAWE
jgi:hypothetical protein